MRAGIYMILNNQNKKCYIGQSRNLASRRYEHFKKLKENKHISGHLQNSWNKYGEENFEFVILEYITDLELLTEREIYWIKEKNSFNSEFGYNLSFPRIGDHPTVRESTKEKLRINTYNQFYKDNPDMSFEDFMKGKRSKDLNPYIKRGHANSKPVYVFDKITGEKAFEFHSIWAAANHFETTDESLRRVLDRDNRTYKGYFFVRAENYDKDKVYKKVYKVKEKIVKERFKGFPIEFFNLDTNELLYTFDTKVVAAEYFNVNKKAFNKVLYDGRKSWRGMGVRLLK